MLVVHEYIRILVPSSYQELCHSRIARAFGKTDRDSRMYAVGCMMCFIPIPVLESAHGALEPQSFHQMSTAFHLTHEVLTQFSLANCMM